VVAGPGEGNASDSNIRDVITGPCTVYRVTYDFGHMGDMQRGNPIDLPRGMITSIDHLGMPWSPKGNAPHGEWSFYPGRDEVNVLRNDHYEPTSIACAAEPA
jgi:hypothetical protein